MKQGDRRYTLVTLRSGQPRAYADSVYEFDIIVEWIRYDTRIPEAEWKWEPMDLAEQLVIQAAKAIGRSWNDNPDWAAPTLKSKTKIGPGHWRFLVTEAYTD